MSGEAFPQQPEASLEPFNEFVLKTANGCNMQPQHELERDPLALVTPGCDHCYMYTRSTVWEQEPDFMEPPIVERAIQRIAEHAEAHRLAHVRIIAHGGEPLLVLRKYPQYYADLAATAHRYIDPIGTKTHLFIQTNGLLINDRGGGDIVKQLRDANFNIGLSLDGPQTVNDLHRRDKAGRSTHSRAERAAKILGEAGANWGILGVIDPRTNPETTLEYLASLDPGSINLFPLHAHNSAPPIDRPNAISLGEWQIRAFNRYNNWHLYHPGTTGPPFEMPIYNNYLQMAFGARSINDTAGERTTQEIFVTPSGRWGRLDTLESAANGATVTGRNIFEDSLNDMRYDRGIIARRMGFAALSPLCQGCEVRDLCFGGHYPNRYKEPGKLLTPESSVTEFAEAFRHPSAHCADHLVFLSYVDRLVKKVPKPAPQPVAAAVAKPGPEDPIVPVNLRSTVAKHQRHCLKEASIIPQAARLFNQCSNYQNFPLPAQPNGYYLAPEDIETTFRAIQDRKLVGREALMAATMIAQTMHPGPVAYYSGGTEDRIPTYEEVVTLSADYNDAIVNSILPLTQPHLKGVNAWARQKSEGYWFITREIADRVVKHHDKISGYAIPVQLPKHALKNSPFGSEHGMDYWESIFHRSITSPIPLTVYDLPGDILVVDTLTDNSQDSVRLVKEAAHEISRHKNPEILARAFENDGRGTIAPLWGLWPSSLHGINWQPRAHMPAPLHEVRIANEAARAIEGEIQNHTIPMFNNGRPLYQNVLELA